jgi:hypothetical protein
MMGHVDDPHVFAGIDADDLVGAFFEQLSTTRHNGAATRNVRLAAIRAFFRGGRRTRRRAIVGGSVEVTSTSCRPVLHRPKSRIIICMIVL